LFDLGYPELALGDVYKAHLLVEAALRNDDWLGETVLLYTGMSIWLAGLRNPLYSLMDQDPEVFRTSVTNKLRELEENLAKGFVGSLFCAVAFADAAHFSRENMRRFPWDKVHAEHLQTALGLYKWKSDLKYDLEYQGVSDALTKRALNSGNLKRAAYPWIPESLLTRDEKVLEAVRKDFSNVTKKCNVSRSQVRDHIKTTSTMSGQDVYGVIASEGIRRGETVLLDEGVTSVTNCPNRCPNCCGSLPPNPSVLSCCRPQFCSPKCSVQAFKEYHQVLCKKDFSFLLAAAHGCLETDVNLENLLLLRIIAMAIQEGVANPLSSSLMRRLTPQYAVGTSFSFVEHIANPIRTLQQLGINIFEDLNYDTWVIHTMRHRLVNNANGSDIEGKYHLTSCLPLYSMFNHSCEPNISYCHHGSGGYLRLYAKRKIKKGEELFIGYTDVEDLTKAERQKVVMPWLGAPCRCTRCERER
jgi:hypothetical protein